jgi:hypothetical protein
MYSVVDDKNISLFTSQKIYGTYPRGSNIVNPIQNAFVAYGINEFENKYILNGRLNEVTPETPHYVMIDIANGHMGRLTHLIRKARRMFYGKKELILMVGNIAHPKTYQNLANAGANYVRLGIGSGSACFVDGTEITMSDGKVKKIELVRNGDIVSTHKDHNDVIAVTRFKNKKKKILNINNEIKCTEDHRFWVVEKSDTSFVTDENINQYAKWIRADELDPNKYLLIKKS